MTITDRPPQRRDGDPPRSDGRPDLLAHPDWAHLVTEARKVDAMNRRRNP